MAVFTLADAKTFLKYRNGEDLSARAAAMYTDVANQANQALRRLGKWDFDKRRTIYTLAAPYETGTVDATVEGSTLAGSGTVWTSAMSNRLIRMDDEPIQYLFTYSGATAGSISPAYKGAAALSGASYRITDERFALPARCRAIENLLCDELITPLQPMDFERLLYLRMWNREVSFPRAYAVEWVESSNTPSGYIWHYPAPDRKRVITLTYYQDPAKLSGDSDVFQLPDEEAAVSALKEYLWYFLLRSKEQFEAAAQQLAIAEKEARAALAKYRVMEKHGQRQEYSAGGDYQVSYVPRIQAFE